MSKIIINIDLTETEQQQIMTVVHEEFGVIQKSLDSPLKFKHVYPTSLKLLLEIINKRDSGYVKQIRSLQNHSHFSRQLSMFPEPSSLEVEYNL